MSPQRLITAYSNGIFPWYGFKENREILWWCPLQRFVIFPNEIHISHSMRQLLKKGIYGVTINEAFNDVIMHCSKIQSRDKESGAWLGDDMTNAYKEMHAQKFAVSIEVWEKPKDANDSRKLVGGLYGINIGKNFFGESMFSLVPNASKIALIELANILKPYGGIIDCQFETPHLKSMGGRFISYEEYMKILHP